MTNPLPKNRVRWSAIVQSWDYLQSLPSTTQCYELTEAQAAALRAICQYLGWPNRYSDNPLPEWSETNDFRASVESALNAPRECVTMRLRQSPTNPCILQASYDDGATWSTAFNYALCGIVPDGIILKWTIEDGYQVSFDNGATWQDGTAYDPRASAPQFPLPPIESGQNGRCLAANNITQELKANVESVRQQLAANSGIAGLSGAFGALMTLIFASAPLAGLVWVIASACAAIIGYSANAFIAAFTQQVWDDVFAIIYCASNDDMTYDDAALDTIYQNINATLTGVASIHLDNVIALMGVVGLTNTARINHGVYNDTLCECTEEWCYTIDFTATDGGFVSYGQGATYVSGTGWQTVYSQYAEGEVVFIARGWSIATVITQASFNYTWNGTPPDENAAIQYGDVDYSSYGASPIQVTQESSATEIHFIIGNGGYGSTVSGQITSCTIRGTGYNPFGASNCQ